MASGFQKIYADALKRPPGGYAADRHFKRAAVDCPKCSGDVYARMRYDSTTALGAVCAACGWLETYHQLAPEPKAPEQPLLFESEVVHPPGHFSRTDRFERAER